MFYLNKEGVEALLVRFGNDRLEERAEEERAEREVALRWRCNLGTEQNERRERRNNTRRDARPLAIRNEWPNPAESE